LKNKIRIGNDEIFYFFNCKRLLYYSLNSENGEFQTENALEPDRINMIRDFFKGEFFFDAGYNSEKTLELLSRKKSVLRPALVYETKETTVNIKPQALYWDGNEYMICIAHFSRNKNKRHAAISSIAYAALREMSVEVSRRIYYIQRKRLTKNKVDEYFSKNIINDILRVKNGEIPEPEGRRLCNVCEYWDECNATQPDKAYLSLSTIRGIGSNMLEFFSEKGINTIEDLLKTPVNEELRQEIKSIDRLKMQAYAFSKDVAVFINGSTEIIPEPKGEPCYLDIEAENYPYLFGFFENEEYNPIFFENETKLNENSMEIFKYLSSKQFTVYHYCEYETKVLNSLAKKIKFSLRNTNFVDVYMKLKQNVVLPLRHYSLKNVAKWLGFSWRVNLDGRSSIMEFKRWVKTGNDSHLKMILKYNEDDCRATKIVGDWLMNPQLFNRKLEILDRNEVEGIIQGNIKI